MSSNGALLLDQYDGITEHLHEGQDDTFAIQRTCDVESVLEANKRAMQMGDGYSPSREFRHIAEIPVAWVEMKSRELGVDLQSKEGWPVLRRLLKDPENAGFRISKGNFN